MVSSEQGVANKRKKQKEKKRRGRNSEKIERKLEHGPRREIVETTGVEALEI